MMEYGCVNLPDAWLFVGSVTGAHDCLRFALTGVRMISRA